MRRLNTTAVVGVILLALLMPGANAKTGVYAQDVRTRSGEWTQSRAVQFAAGQRENVIVTTQAGGQVQLAPGAVAGTFTSLAFTPAFAFDSLAAIWDAELPQGSSLQVDLRAFAGAQGWTPWKPLINVEWIPNKGRYAPEAPLILSGERLQYRVRMQAGAGGSPALREITVIYMDTSVGPTTTMAKRRTEVGPPTAQGVPKPPIITRAGWGADESLRDWEPEYRPVEKIVLHHTVTPNGYAEDQAAQWVRAIYYYHAVSLGWGDIGYNYVVDRYGNIYEGRYGGPGAVGAHVYNYNYGSVGVALMGTHGNMSTAQEPTQAAWDAVARLSVWESSRSFLHPLERSQFGQANTDNLAGHRDYPPNQTSCPGDLAYDRLPALRQDVWNRLAAALPRYQVEWLSWEAPGSDLERGTVKPNSTYTLVIRVRNLGSWAWTRAGGNNVRLGYHWSDASGRPVFLPPGQDHRTMLPADVTFGHTAELVEVRVTTPSAPGQYTLAWDMVHEGVTWFHDANSASPLLEMPLTVEPVPAPGEDPVRNGGFEYDGDWAIFETPYPARYTTRVSHSDSRALQTGIFDPVENVYSYSSAEQVFRLPSRQRIQLRYWYQGIVSSGDYAYTMIQPAGGGWRLLLFERVGAADWTVATHDLSAFAGQEVRLRFGTYNDGRGGVSAMYVDDVSVLASDVLPEPTPVPTPTPTPTPSGPPCAQLVQNGGFESGGGWVIYQTPAQARLTGTVARSGQRSLQVGIGPGMEHRYSYSSAEQRLAIPAGRTARLSLWYTIPDPGGSGDNGYLLLRPDGGTWRYLGTLRDPTPGWTPFEVDLSGYAGQSVTLRIGMRNDGRDVPMVMYVDDVSLEACLR